jgi:hypothetical protein
MKAITPSTLALFIGLTFSNIAIGGYFQEFVADKYRCKIEYVQLYAVTGLETLNKYTHEFSDNDGCHSKLMYVGLSKEVDKWIKLSPNNIIAYTSLAKCKIDNADFFSIFNSNWGDYFDCSEQNTLGIINEITEEYSEQISNIVKYPDDYPQRNTYDDI